MHHVKPRSQGGTKVKPLCFRCHSQIHGLDRDVSTSELTRKAMAKRQSEGGHIGSPPLGYCVREGKLEAVEAELATVARIKELRAEGYTLRRVAAILTEEGFPTKRGGSWGPATVYNILKRVGAQ